MRPVVTLAAVALLALAALPTSTATLGCVGYQACYQATGDGWAILCLWPPIPNVTLHCVDLVCESCGNLPIRGDDASAPLEVLP
jgi:hypothetical protein